MNGIMYGIGSGMLQWGHDKIVMEVHEWDHVRNWEWHASMGP